jgi:two-component system response regulator HydG
MNSTATILLVDDEVAHLKTLERVFNKEGYEVLATDSGEEALDLLREHRVNLVITDLMMPDLDGMDLLKLVKTLRPETETILMTAFGTVERAVQGMKEGAYDFITKPIKRATILKAARQALERQALVAENRALKARIAELRDKHSIVGQSSTLRGALDLVGQVAASDVTVLLTGESGTGKELFARMIFERSDRAERPFIAVNCAALPESILESELFGYEKGAFTGANERKIGKFEAADTGTLFLDEIGELSPKVQVKLLRVLQEGEFDRVGATTPTRVDVRIIAATNRDLEEEMRTGRFREDLYYRLNVVNIQIPPLRDRREDIPLLAEHFLQRYRQKNRREILGFSSEALSALDSHAWPGNVRELENVVERAVVLDRDGVIDTDDLPDQIVETPHEERTLTIRLGTSLDEIERRVIHETLRMTNGDKKLAAKLLGIATRTIYRKI